MSAEIDLREQPLLQQFFVVTITSVYHVKAQGDCRASAIKIADHGQGEILVGQDIVRGGMIAICRWLQAYIPEKYGWGDQRVGDERQIEMVNTAYWGHKTSLIVALFRTLSEADECFNSPDQQPRDPRWIESTKQVIEAVGSEHPSFCVAFMDDLALLPKANVPA